MRLRPAVVLSALAMGALVLSGCSGDPEPEATPSAPAADVCGAALPDGDGTQGLAFGGEAGAQPQAEFETPLEITEPLRTVVTEGDGPALEDGQWVDYSMAIFDAATGELMRVGGYDSDMVPLHLSTLDGSAQMLGCAPIGSRIAITVPGSTQAPAAVYVLDVKGIHDLPTRAWGEDEAPVEGQPAVELAEDGAPTITLPDTEPPAETEVTTLKKGDGPVVEAGQDVIAHYVGVKWSDGSVFDSSWERGVPAPFNTRGVVAGFTKALEGQTVGSQVLVTMPPEDGYAIQPGHELEKETLTFVVDILDSGEALAQP